MHAGKDTEVKQESYVRLIKEKTEYLAKAMKLSESGSGQPQKDKSQNNMTRSVLTISVLEDTWKVTRVQSREIG